MANVYEDFDKRMEHERRFNETILGREAPAYTAPRKARSVHDSSFTSDLQKDLPEHLLDVAPLKSRRDAR